MLLCKKLFAKRMDQESSDPTKNHHFKYQENIIPDKLWYRV